MLQIFICFKSNSELLFLIFFSLFYIERKRENMVKFYYYYYYYYEKDRKFYYCWPISHMDPARSNINLIEPTARCDYHMIRK